MKVNYTGIHPALAPKLQGKLDARFHKLSTLLDHPGGEHTAHVVVTGERHLRKAEITLQIHDHSLVGLASDADLFTAVWDALEKLEKQAVKQLAREREKSRRNPRSGMAPASSIKAVEEPAPAEKVSSKNAAPKNGKQPARTGKRPRIFSVRDHVGVKPMTLEEAMLEMEDGRGYMVYRDPERELLTMLVRRADGHFDLIET